MWGFLLEAVLSACCCFSNSEIEAWGRHSEQPSQASDSHQQLLGRGRASLLSARLCLSWCSSHPLTLPQSWEPFGQAYRIQEKLLHMEFKGLRSSPVLALQGFWRGFGINLFDLLLFGFRRKDTGVIYLCGFSCLEFIFFISQHF